MKSDILKKLLLFAWAAGITLVGAEIALRIFYPRKATFYDLSEDLIYRPIPGARMLFVHPPENGGDRIVVEMNEDGFRGPPLREDGEAIRVAVYGDSCIMGAFSSEPDTYVQQLANKLTAELGQPVEVINAGVVGYGPDQAILRMQKELPSLRPDLVVLALFAHNDFGDLIRNRLFRLNADGALEAQEIRLAPELLAEFRRSQWPILGKYAWFQLDRMREWFSKSETDLMIHSPTAYAKLWKRDFKYFIQGDNEVTNLFHDYYDADMALAPHTASSAYKTDLLTALLAKAARSTREADVPLLAVIIPSPVDVWDQFEIQVNRDRHPDYRRATLSTLMAQSAQEAGVPSLNLFSAFREQQYRRLYFGNGDDHWTALGQRIAARKTADFVLEQLGAKIVKADKRLYRVKP